MADFITDILSIDALVEQLDGTSKEGLQMLMKHPDLLSRVANGDAIAQAVHQGMAAKINKLEQQEQAAQLVQATAAHADWMKWAETERTRIAEEARAQGRQVMPMSDEAQQAALAAQEAAMPKTPADSMALFAQSLRDIYGNVSAVEEALNRNNGA